MCSKRRNVRAIRQVENDTTSMRRRNFLKLSSGFVATAALASRGFAKEPKPIDAEWYRKSSRFKDLSMSRVAYVEHGHGPTALFVHGYPLKSYQWRGALERLHEHRRCIAPDAMGMRYTQTPKEQKITPETQVEMLGKFLDSLHIDTVDVVANDSGGMVSQLFVA